MFNKKLKARIKELESDIRYKDSRIKTGMKVIATLTQRVTSLERDNDAQRNLLRAHRSITDRTQELETRNLELHHELSQLKSVVQTSDPLVGNMLSMRAEIETLRQANQQLQTSLAKSEEANGYYMRQIAVLENKPLLNPDDMLDAVPYALKITGFDSLPKLPFTPPKNCKCNECNQKSRSTNFAKLAKYGWNILKDPTLVCAKCFGKGTIERYVDGKNESFKKTVDCPACKGKNKQPAK